MESVAKVVLMWWFPTFTALDVFLDLRKPRKSRKQDWRPLYGSNRSRHRWNYC